MKPRKAKLRIIDGMEFPVLIGINTVKSPLEKPLIRTWNDESKKYEITQYDHVMYHEGCYKLFLNIYECATRIMKSLGEILKEDLYKHNFRPERFTGDAYEQ